MSIFKCQRVMLALAAVALVSAVAEVAAAVASAGTTATSASLRTCAPSKLTLHSGFTGAGLGTFYKSFYLTNDGSVSCKLGGWPGFQVVNAGGRKVKTTAKRYRTNDAPKPAWKELTVNPGHSVAFAVSAEDYNHAANKACPKTSAVLVIPPNTRRQLKVKAKIDRCSDTFNVVPLVAGRKDRNAPSTPAGS